MSSDFGGPALFIGGDTTFMLLTRPRLDPADPGVRAAAEQAGVSAEEFAGPGNVWALVLDDGFECDGGFELPGLRDAEADDFAERLQAALGTGEPFTVEAGAVLRLDGRPSTHVRTGEGYVFTVHATPPEPEGAPTVSLETGTISRPSLLADLEAFRRSLA
ncbi:hypothetical protein ACWGF3_39560 [Streptomyces xanthophaeus]|uniref:Uncharacterized protein n=1 Tax=Streptomyces xanthophaeus TaxID=67385 RepID=A0A919LHF5_9ACTN|nr:hypothetical protein [Streptomyces xanthophaeus]GHI88112.1 hypothetical protein Sxan_54760 [Streptomyces xanthophaeus]